MRLEITVGVLGLSALLSASSAFAGSGCSCSNGAVTVAPAQTAMSMAPAPNAPPQAPVAITQNGQTYRSFSYDGVPSGRSSSIRYQRSAPARSPFDASSKALGKFGRSAW